MTSAHPIRLGIVGVGKIVRDQHLPAVAGNPDFVLVAAASRNATIDGIANFRTIEELLEGADVDTVSLCMPPSARYAAARTAINAGKHVFLEKPPGATVSEVEDLKAFGIAKGISVFASWHSRYAPAVEAARAFLAGARTINSVKIIWKEDVRRWHPDQAWIWQPGGFGVFDPGINALSIATHIIPHPFFVTEANLDFPANRDTPVAAQITFASAGGYPVTADLDWLQTGPQTWDIVAETDGGRMVLSGGGSKLIVNDKVVHEEPEREYPMLYERFASLIRGEASDVDIAPLQHVADAFMLGKRNVVDMFED